MRPRATAKNRYLLSHYHVSNRPSVTGDFFPERAGLGRRDGVVDVPRVARAEVTDPAVKLLPQRCSTPSVDRMGPLPVPLHASIGYIPETSGS
jgi:hypothetical protein